MITSQIESYTFDKTTRKVTFSGLSSIRLDKIISVVDVTNNVQIYYFKLPNYGGEVAGNVLTLDYDTTGDNFNNTDKLLIEYITGEGSTGVAVPSNTVVADGFTAEQTSFGKGAIFYFDVSAVAGGAPSLVFKIQGKNPATGVWSDVPGAITAPLLAIGSKSLMIYPGIAEVANSKVSAILPSAYRIGYTMAGATSMTFSVSVSYVN
jgi:hypothetical protein